MVAAKEMIALAFSTTPDNWRRVAHIISDKVYQRLTGEEGYFDTRIIYVAETGKKNPEIQKTRDHGSRWSECKIFNFRK